MDVDFLRGAVPLNERVVQGPPDALGVSVEAVKPVRARKILRRLGCGTLGGVVRYTGDELLELKNFGVATLFCLRDRLADLGLYLWDQQGAKMSDKLVSGADFVGLSKVMGEIDKTADRMEREAAILEKARQAMAAREEAYTAALVRCALIEAAGRIVSSDRQRSEHFVKQAERFLEAEFDAQKKETP